MNDNQLFAYINSRAKHIRQLADRGDRTSRNIITTYNMYYRFPEPGALGILYALVETWQKQNADELDAANDEL